MKGGELWKGPLGCSCTAEGEGPPTAASLDFAYGQEMAVCA